MTESVTAAAVFTSTPVEERFGADVATHRLTILHDNGLYRHLRFRRWLEADPEKNRPASWSSSYWFDLITWPGSLVVNGDMHTFAFSRLDDMFEFFRGSRINPSYWAEKCTAGKTDGYSEDVFREAVAGAVKEAEGAYPGLTASVQERFYGCMAEWDTSREDGAREALSEFTYQPEGAKGEPFMFTDSWEWHLRDWDFFYLWNCHAIQWGIAQYDAAKRPAEAVTAGG